MTITLKIKTVFDDKQLVNIGKELAEKVEMGVEKAARECETMAKELAPVRTGYLKSSIQCEKIDNLNWLVAAQAEYSGYVEFGTRFSAPRPYMTPAASKAIENLQRFMSLL